MNALFSCRAWINVPQMISSTMRDEGWLTTHQCLKWTSLFVTPCFQCFLFSVKTLRYSSLKYIYIYKTLLLGDFHYSRSTFYSVSHFGNGIRHSFILSRILLKLSSKLFPKNVSLQVSLFLFLFKSNVT